MPEICVVAGGNKLGGSLSSLKVMIVDDNKHMRTLLETVLRAFGCVDFIHANDGQDAIAQLQVKSPDLIITDIEMEGMGGIEMTKAVRAGKAGDNPLVPIIMVSGYSSIEQVSAARNAGINEFLVKPINIQGIFTRLQSVIERPRPFVRTKSYFGPDRRRNKKAEYTGDERREEEAVVEVETQPRSVFG